MEEMERIEEIEEIEMPYGLEFADEEWAVYNTGGSGVESIEYAVVRKCSNAIRSIEYISSVADEEREQLKGLETNLQEYLKEWTTFKKWHIGISTSKVNIGEERTSGGIVLCGVMSEREYETAYQKVMGVGEKRVTYQRFKELESQMLRGAGCQKLDTGVGEYTLQEFIRELRGVEWRAREDEQRAVMGYIGLRISRERHTENYEEVKKRAGYRCAYCGGRGELTVDHKLPLIYGGTDEIWNLQCLCKSCNSSKRERYDDSLVLKKRWGQPR